MQAISHLDFDLLITLLLGPPIMACLWWLASRGFGAAVQGGTVSQKTKRRQKIEFWVLLGALYLLGFGIFIYSILPSR